MPNYIVRNYDKNPVIIPNNFTSMIFGITYWLIFNSFMIYLIFFGEVIDWSQNKDWLIILKNELEKSFRFGTVLIGILITNIMAFYALYRNIKKKRKITLTDNYIKSSKNFNDLEYLELKDIKYIKKSFFPLLLTGYSEQSFNSLIGFIVASPFIILASVIGFLIQILSNKYFQNFNYIILFSRKNNKVLNIHLTSKKEYLDLKEFFLKKTNINLDQIDINFKLSNIKGEI